MSSRTQAYKLHREDVVLFDLSDEITDLAHKAASILKMTSMKTLSDESFLLVAQHGGDELVRLGLNEPDESLLQFAVGLFRSASLDPQREILRVFLVEA